MTTNEIEEAIDVNNKTATVTHPWRRHFARSLDLSVYGVIWGYISLLILRWSPGSNIFRSLFDSYIIIGLMLIIEPLLLSTWGTTLGKWVFGLLIRNVNGEKLTYRQAYQRTLGVFCNGMGYYIPIYSLIREYKCYVTCQDEKPLSWEEDFNYTIKDTKLIRGFTFVGLSIVSFIAIFLVVSHSMMPINRGKITAEEYYENCNDIISYYKMDFGKQLDNQGKWVDSAPDNYIFLEESSLTLPEHKLTILDGIVKEVKIEIETDTNDIVIDTSNQKFIALMSFLGAQKEMNFKRLNKSGILEEISNGSKDYSFVEAGIRVTQKVESRGYDLTNQYIFPIEGQDQYYHMVFTMEKIEP